MRVCFARVVIFDGGGVCMCKEAGWCLVGRGRCSVYAIIR